MSIIIDAHTHVGTRHAASQSGAELVDKLDAVGAQKAVMFPFVEGNFTNDEIKVAYDEFPDRLIPYCAVNPWQPDAVAEFRRCVTEWSFKGLKLHPTINGYHLSDPALVNPLFEEAESFGVPIIVHGASDLLNSPPEFAEMARRFPRVKLLMAHMGFFWSVDQAIEYARDIPNLYLETSRAPIFEVTNAVRELGPDRVIWGTDAPVVDYEWEFKKMERCTPDKAIYNRVMGGTMADILGL
jgi:uncharacterized protein